MQPDVLLGDGVGDSVHRGAHHVLVDRADAADAQRVDLRQLAGVEHEALLPHAVVELLEVVARILRGVEGHDHRRLVARLEEQLETQARHASQRFLRDDLADAEVGQLGTELRVGS